MDKKHNNDERRKRKTTHIKLPSHYGDPPKADKPEVVVPEILNPDIPDGALRFRIHVVLETSTAVIYDKEQTITIPCGNDDAYKEPTRITLEQTLETNKIHVLASYRKHKPWGNSNPNTPESDNATPELTAPKSDSGSAFDIPKPGTTSAGVKAEQLPGPTPVVDAAKPVQKTK